MHVEQLYVSILELNHLEFHRLGSGQWPDEIIYVFMLLFNCNQVLRQYFQTLKVIFLKGDISLLKYFFLRLKILFLNLDLNQILKKLKLNESFYLKKKK